MHRQRGLTLLELMVSVSVLVILLGIGIPGMAEIIQKNRRAATVNALVTDIQRARNTAASLGRSVIVCHSANGTSCSGNGAPDWNSGWIAFVDDNANGNKESTDPVIAVQRPRGGVAMPSTRGQFTFSPGFRPIEAGTVAVCVDPDPLKNRWIAVNVSGRPELQTADDLPPVPCP